MTGIDYGMGQTNIDMATRIRYGVIPQHDVLQAWADSSEGDYGPATCPECGNEAISVTAETTRLPESAEEWPNLRRRGSNDWACTTCQHYLDAEDAFGDEAQRFTLDDGEYVAEQSGDDSDIFVIKSPYYTYAPFCSPCAPGAGYLRSAAAHDASSGVKTYCFGHDWFEDGKAPYRVYRVEDDTEVEADDTEVEAL